MAASNDTKRVTSPSYLAHVVLRTSPEKYSEMVDFYVTFLGGKVVLKNEMLAFITYDEEHHRIALVAIPGLKPKDPGTSGLEHISFAYKSIDDLLGSYTQRKEHGIQAVWPVNHGPTLSIYYRDPDGNTLETQVDCFDTSAEATAYMYGPEFQENPLGVDFNPDEYIEKRKQGVPAKELFKRPNIGARTIDSVPIA